MRRLFVAVFTLLLLSCSDKSKVTNSPDTAGKRISSSSTRSESVKAIDNRSESKEETGEESGESPDPALALAALYRATDGENWAKNTNWLNHDVPLGLWYGVETDHRGRVIILDLHNNQLSGSIPAELGQLANLEALALSNNQLSGRIPTELGQLANLEVLVLSNNQLSGRIPTELGQLANLHWLALFDNQLSGPIPPELGQLKPLSQLAIANNQFSGRIPAELGQLVNLAGLFLHNNQLRADRSRSNWGNWPISKSCISAATS